MITIITKGIVLFVYAFILGCIDKRKFKKEQEEYKDHPDFVLMMMYRREIVSFLNLILAAIIMGWRI